MKKFIYLLLAALLIFITACRSPSPVVSPTVTTVSPTTAVTDLSPPPTAPETSQIPGIPEKGYSNTNGNSLNGGYVYVYENYIFYANTNTTGEHVYRYDTNTGETIKFIEDTLNGSLNVYGDRLYYAIDDTITKKYGIFSCNLDGSDIKQYYDDSSIGFIIADAEMYVFSTFGVNSIFKIKLIDDSVTEIHDRDYNFNVNVTNDKIYYTSFEGLEFEGLDENEEKGRYAGLADMRAGLIHSMNRDGSENTLLSDKIVLNLIAEGDWLYYLNEKTLKVERMNLFTLQSEEISEFECSDFNILNEKIYCATDNGIEVIDLEGKQIKQYKIDGYHWDTEINLFEGFIYFRQPYERSIYRVNESTGKVEVFYLDTYTDRSLNYGPPISFIN